MISCNIPLYSQPDDVQVKKELNTILEELGMKNKADENQREIKINPIIKFLGNLIIKIISLIARAGPALLVIIIIVLVFIAGSVGLRFYSSIRQKKDESAKLNKIEAGTQGYTHKKEYNEYIQNAELLARSGHYGKALVLLHKASIIYLHIQKILLAGEYHTNNEIRIGLRSNKEYYESFCKLANTAELVTFRSEAISKNKYNELSELYKKSFIL